jgi:hypothetical protein
LRAITAADIFPHTAGLPIVPIVTKAGKRQGDGSEDVRIVMCLVLQPPIKFRQIVTFFVSLF